MPAVAHAHAHDLAALHDDPVWRAALAAPIDDSPETEEERAAVEEIQRMGFRADQDHSLSTHT